MSIVRAEVLVLWGVVLSIPCLSQNMIANGGFELSESRELDHRIDHGHHILYTSTGTVPDWAVYPDGDSSGFFPLYAEEKWLAQRFDGGVEAAVSVLYDSLSHSGHTSLFFRSAYKGAPYNGTSEMFYTQLVRDLIPKEHYRLSFYARFSPEVREPGNANVDIGFFASLPWLEQLINKEDPSSHGVGEFVWSKGERVNSFNFLIEPDSANHWRYYVLDFTAWPGMTWLTIGQYYSFAQDWVADPGGYLLIDDLNLVRLRR